LVAHFRFLVALLLRIVRAFFLGTRLAIPQLQKCEFVAFMRHGL
jgi:hypothetical protein